MAVETLGNLFDLKVRIKAFEKYKIVLEDKELSWHDYINGVDNPDYKTAEDFLKHRTTVLAVLYGIWHKEPASLTQNHCELINGLFGKLDRSQSAKLKAKCIQSAAKYLNNFTLLLTKIQPEDDSIWLRILPLPKDLSTNLLFWYLIKLMGTTFVEQIVDHEVNVKKQMCQLQQTLRNDEVDLSGFYGRDFAEALVEVIMNSKCPNTSMLHQTLQYCLAKEYDTLEVCSAHSLLKHLCVVPLVHAMPFIEKLMKELRAPKIKYTKENIVKNTVPSLFLTVKPATFNAYSGAFFEHLLNILENFNNTVPLFYHAITRSATAISFETYVQRLDHALRHREVNFDYSARYMKVHYTGTDKVLTEALDKHMYVNNWDNYPPEEPEHSMEVDYDLGGDKCPLPPLTKHK